MKVKKSVQEVIMEHKSLLWTKRIAITVLILTPFGLIGDSLELKQAFYATIAAVILVLVFGFQALIAEVRLVGTQLTVQHKDVE